LPKFLVIALLGVAISGAGVRAAVAMGIHYVLAQVICTVLVLVLGFVLNRVWTFREKRSSLDAAEASPSRGASGPTKGSPDSALAGDQAAR
jgi:putative flippase GtrA